MAGELSILGFVAELGRMTVRANLAAAVALERAAVVVEKEAKQEIGHYQSAVRGFPRWEPLAASTVREKKRLGFAPPDNPLRRRGEMAASIGHRVEVHGIGGEAETGSDSWVALFQEGGTSRMEARSFLGQAAVRKEDQIVRELGDAVAVALGAVRIR